MNLEKIEKTINEAFENKNKIDSSDKTLNDLVSETINLLDCVDIYYLILCKNVDTT